MQAVARYWNTLRHLRPIQIYGRLRLRLTTPRIDLGPGPSARVGFSRGWTSPAPHRAALLAPDCVEVLNDARNISDHGWDDPALDKLWRYNLHYFDDLTAVDAPLRTSWHAAFMSRWVGENPPFLGTGWEPYPTSLRIVNWIKWTLAGNALPVECARSLVLQTRWLTRRLETHLLGNHLIANAKALVFAGAFFEGAEAEGWTHQGLEVLQREIPEQILSDGGQFERSPMYHALALEDVLDVLNVTTAFSDHVPMRWHATIDELRSRAASMCLWLETMCHPDGEISFFNDAAIGIAPTPTALADYAARLGLNVPRESREPLCSLHPSGYIRVSLGESRALLDVALIGPDYLPGHAHADTLSFELSLFGDRVFVNSGTSRYGEGPERLRQRGTAAHNTVVIDGKDSSEVWGGFRVARRARPYGLEVAQGDHVVIRCSHDGYTRLPGHPVHERLWTCSSRSLVVEDRVKGGNARAEARFHVHPLVGVSVLRKREDATTVLLELPGGRSARFHVDRGAVHLEPSTWHPEFGKSVPNVCIVVVLHDGIAHTRTEWDDA